MFALNIYILLHKHIQMVRTQVLTTYEVHTIGKEKLVLFEFDNMCYYIIQL